MNSQRPRPPKVSPDIMAAIAALAEDIFDAPEKHAALVRPRRRGRGKAQRSLALIEAAKAILAEIQPATVRAVCYRLFAAGYLTSMAKGETNKVSVQLTYARERGLIPWDWIVDETREAERVNAWENPAEYVETVKRAYRRDRWRDQPAWIEVWSEKGTIRGTLAPVLNAYGVTFRVMHGYTSTTAIHQVEQECAQTDKILTAFYLGDWDCSGLHMSDVDLPQRLDFAVSGIDLQRIALTDADVLSGTIPSFASDTKRKDPRYSWFVGSRYAQGLPHDQCYELDALSPVILRQRVEQAIVKLVDVEAWERAEIAETAEKDSLLSILTAWPGISRQASK